MCIRDRLYFAGADAGEITGVGCAAVLAAIVAYARLTE